MGLPDRRSPSSARGPIPTPGRDFVAEARRGPGTSTGCRRGPTAPGRFTTTKPAADFRPSPRWTPTDSSPTIMTVHSGLLRLWIARESPWPHAWSAAGAKHPIPTRSIRLHRQIGCSIAAKRRGPWSAAPRQARPPSAPHPHRSSGCTARTGAAAAAGRTF